LCSIKSWSTFDLFVGYVPTANFELGFVVNNVGNVQAPFDERFARRYTTAYNPTYTVPSAASSS
jgi:outer membrane receptor protein involved in Fe transport